MLTKELFISRMRQWLKKVEITNVQVLNFAQEVTLAQLPVTHFSYQGREENAG
ncbi:MAG: hypothetical protein ACSLE0_22170 [Chitinophagaceae bacterium]